MKRETNLQLSLTVPKNSFKELDITVYTKKGTHHFYLTKDMDLTSFDGIPAEIDLTEAQVTVTEPQPEIEKRSTPVLL
jgi:hypothetical protein